MQGDSGRALAQARLIAMLVYAGPLVVFPIVGRAAKASVSVDAEVLPVLAAVLGVVGVVDYGLSLFIEEKMLARARSGGRQSQNAILATAVVVAAFGATLAVYGLVLTLLGAPGWGSAFYVLTAAHGLHLVLRWPRYERAAEGTPY